MARCYIAQALGMVDAVVPKTQLHAAAVTEMKRRIAMPDPGRIGTKHFLRKEARLEPLRSWRVGAMGRQK